MQNLGNEALHTFSRKTKKLIINFLGAAEEYKIGYIRHNI